jgi:hypothetical protein
VDEGLELESLPGELAFRRADAGRFFDELLGGVAGQNPYAARDIGLLSTQERKEKNRDQKKKEKGTFPKGTLVLSPG